MRITHNTKEITAIFHDDLPGGGMLLEGCCGRFIHDNCEGYDLPYLCKQCGNEIKYPGWASW